MRPLQKKKSKSTHGTSATDLLKDIQAMIKQQEINTKNRNKLRVGGAFANNFINDPSLNEHKTIDEQFKRRDFKSLAIELYQSKVQTNPMRLDDKALAQLNKENAGNMTTLNSSRHKHSLEQPGIIRPPFTAKATDGGDLNLRMILGYQTQKPDRQERNHQSTSLLPSAFQTRHSFNSQTISSQQRTQSTAKTFEHTNRFNNAANMPYLKSNTNGSGEAVDMSLAQIVQLGKKQQRERSGNYKKHPRNKSHEAVALPRRPQLGLEDVEDSNADESYIALPPADGRRDSTT